jgi:hypothetical protein
MKLPVKAIILPLALLMSAQASAAAVEVMKSPYCACCSKWIEHLQQHGFQVKVTNTDRLHAIKDELKVPAALRSCHTAKIGKYVVEGHVPVADIKRLLKEKPNATGIAVAGMPMGAPGMEHGNHKEPYKTMIFGANGTKVYASH